MKQCILSMLLLTMLGFSCITAKAQTSSTGIDPPSPLFQINHVYHPRGFDDLKPIKNGDVLYSGDHCKIIFSSDKDCYVYIFQVDSAENIFQLFPMKRFKGVRK